MGVFGENSLTSLTGNKANGRDWMTSRNTVWAGMLSAAAGRSTTSTKKDPKVDQKGVNVTATVTTTAPSPNLGGNKTNGTEVSGPVSTTAVAGTLAEITTAQRDSGSAGITACAT